MKPSVWVCSCALQFLVSKHFIKKNFFLLLFLPFQILNKKCLYIHKRKWKTELLGRAGDCHSSPAPSTTRKKIKRGLGNTRRLSNSCPRRVFPVKACGHSNEIPAWPDKAAHRQAHAHGKTGAWAQHRGLLLALLLWGMGFGLLCDLRE